MIKITVTLKKEKSQIHHNQNLLSLSNHTNLQPINSSLDINNCSHTDCNDQLDTRIAFDCPSPSSRSFLSTDANTQFRGLQSSLHPLPGVPLPKSEAGWKEMNYFFHAAPIFRFATGAISDLDLAASEFNQSIYSYLRNKYGTLG